MASLQDSSELKLSDISISENAPKENDNATNLKELVSTIKAVDINMLTPLEALSVLDNIISKVK